MNKREPSSNVLVAGGKVEKAAIAASGSVSAIATLVHGRRG